MRKRNRRRVQVSRRCFSSYRQSRGLPTIHRRTFYRHIFKGNLFRSIGYNRCITERSATIPCGYRFRLDIGIKECDILDRRIAQTRKERSIFIFGNIAEILYRLTITINRRLKRKRSKIHGSKSIIPTSTVCFVVPTEVDIGLKNYFKPIIFSFCRRIVQVHFDSILENL